MSQIHEPAVTKSDLVRRCILIKHNEKAQLYLELKKVLYQIYGGYIVSQPDSYTYTSYHCSPAIFWAMWKRLRETSLPIMHVRERVAAKDDKKNVTGFTDLCSLRLMTTSEFRKYRSALGHSLHQQNRHNGS